MGVADYILGSLILILAVALVIAIVLQESKRSGVNGVISGGADTFLSKNKARTADAFLARWTKYIAIAFFVLILVVNIIAIAATSAAS